MKPGLYPATLIAVLDSSMVEKRDENDDRNRNAEKPKQNSTAQSTLLMLR
jgi:hypothetical protein